MARTKDIRVKATTEEHAALQGLATSLCFVETAPALRALGLAAAGDRASLRRVAPHLREFRQQLEALERGPG